MLEDRMAYLQDVYRITGRRFGYFMAQVANGSLTRKRKAPSATTSLWNLEYEPDFAKGRKLYDLAKRKAWNPETDIDWNNKSAKDSLLTKDEYWGAYQMGLTEVLSEEETVELNRRERAWVLSQILHGEQGSLLLCAQLVDMRPDMDGKLFLATQVMDEARHVEVFTRYLKELEIFPVDMNIKFIIDSLLGTPDWHKKAIGMLVLVEGYAMGAFSYTRRSNLDPLLDQILEFVMQDEGRHVGFGIDSIAEEVSHLDEAKRRELEDYAFSLCRTLFYGRERGGFRSQVDLYWESSRGRMGLNRPEFEKAVVTNRALNDFQEDVFHNHLMANLKRLRLLSERVAPRYAELGLALN
ncbi:MAG TPA: ferritin-like domain-containing protein [Chloroflexia bacterium]|nr:ferritin-like domain-containing protein [Chloroflexia bacterium]